MIFYLPGKNKTFSFRVRLSSRHQSVRIAILEQPNGPFISNGAQYQMSPKKAQCT